MRRSKRFGAIAAVLAVATGGGVALAGGDETPTHMTVQGCAEHQGFVAGDEQAVAAALPDRYTPVRDEQSGRPIVFARALHCDAAALDGRSAPATMASYGVLIASPDGRGCASAKSDDGDAIPACNWYTLGWLADDRRVPAWLRDGAPAFPARHEPGLRFDLDGATFHFEAPGTFTMDERARERPGTLAVRGGYWADTPQGTVKLAFSSDDMTSGDADGTVRAPAGSPVAELMGARERPYLAAYATLAAERIPHGSYRKQLLGPPRAGEALDAFDGRCAFAATVTFSPPATNAQQRLDVTTRGPGTCTGTLNGRAIEDVPVTIEQRVREVDGSCVRARTTQPGEGAIAFPDGTRIRYTVDFAFTLTEGTFELYGTRSGFAGGSGTFATERTPPDVAAQCGGAGLREAPLDIRIETDAPLTSARNAPAAGTAPPKADPDRDLAGAPERLRLIASPRRVRAGHRTRFTFRVVTPKGTPVAGARVTFAGRHARTRPSGRARITVRLRRPGRRTARATKPGHRADTATVRVGRRR